MATDNNKVLNVPNKGNVPRLRFPDFVGEWNFKTLETLAPNISAGKDSANEGNYKLYGSTGVIGTTDKPSYNGAILLVARVGANAGYLQYVNGEFGVTDNTLVVNASEDNMYIYYYLHYYNLNRLVFGSGQPLITGGMLKKISIGISKEEKEKSKIVKFLSLLDERITTQNKIIEDLKKLKVAIIEKVFSENKCNCKIGDVISQISHRNSSKKETNILSVSNKWGFVEQSEQFEDRIVASEDITNYKIVRINDFAYNPARINVGSIARLKRYESGIVSPMYICFHSQNALLPEYLELFFYTQYFKHEMYKRLEGSVRLCLSFEGLTNIPIFIPEITTQREISIKVNSIETKIGIEETYLNALKVQKQYLLKHMFI